MKILFTLFLAGSGMFGCAMSNKYTIPWYEQVNPIGLTVNCYQDVAYESKTPGYMTYVREKFKGVIDDFPGPKMLVVDFTKDFKKRGVYENYGQPIVYFVELKECDKSDMIGRLYKNVRR